MNIPEKIKEEQNPIPVKCQSQLKSFGRLVHRGSISFPTVEDKRNPVKKPVIRTMKSFISILKKITPRIVR
ncbi:hypothetical protein J7L87_02510, partial [bacterium]|nr:hypothetical protein [bacterium]